MPPIQRALLAALACAALAAAAPLRYDTSATREPSGDRLQVHIVPHSHDDAGWLKTVDQYYWGLRQDIQAAGVQYILDTVVQALAANPDRRFSFAEMAFFTRWWAQQDGVARAEVARLVAAGRLDFVNGGYVQHDEAAAHYVAMVDQTTLGHRFLKETFGVAPTVGFQVDPFGHSATQAGLLGASVGFDALFFGRADYQDMARRAAARELEVVWRGSGGAPAGDAPAASLLAGNFASGNYGPPPGFWWEWAAGSPDPVIADDPALKEYNVRERVDTFVARCRELANVTAGRDIMLTMGSDFHYANAHVWFKNLDKLIHYVNADGRVRAFYSSPAQYVAAKHSYNATWPVKTDDFFPYADAPHAYWTGYFSSRAASKGYIRAATGYLQAARQLEAFVGRAPGGGGGGGGAPTTAALEEAVALCQHHDAITGTAKQHVANDYHARIHEGLRSAGRVVARALERLIAGEAFPPPSAAAEEQRRWALRAVALGGDRPDASALFAAGEVDNAAEVEAAAAEAGAVRARQEDPSTLRLEGCPWVNVSACAPSVDMSRLGAPIFAVAYNPLAWARAAPLRVPVTSAATATWRVFDPAGKEVPCQLVPRSPATARLQGLLAGVGALDATAAADAELVFTAQLPPVGYSSFVLHPVDPAAAEATAASSPSENDRDGAGAPSFSFPQPSKVSPSLKGPVSISNGLVTVEFDPGTGLMTSLAVADGPTLRLSAALRWYNASDGLESEDNRGQASGAYIFRPNGDYPIAPDTGAAPAAASPLGGLFRSRRAGAGAGAPPPVALEIIQGEEVSEARQTFADWATLTTRLHRGQSQVEVEWTVGPIPIADGLGKEVIVRYASDIASQGVLATDANGRAMVRRRRDARPTWDLDATEPVAGNYYPVTAAAFLEDGAAQLAVVTDRAQGAASLRDGEVELMVHRRALFDDGRGVREPLNETACGCSACDCPGLAVRGRHWLVVAAPGAAPAARRTAQQLMNDPPLALYAPLPSAAANAGPRGSPLRRSLSLTGGRAVGPASHLMTLMRPNPRSLLVRVAHLMEEDEAGAALGGGANGTVTEDLGALLAGFNCGGTPQELTLSANQLRSSAEARRLHFRPGRVLGRGRDGAAAESRAGAAAESRAAAATESRAGAAAAAAEPADDGNDPWIARLRPMEVRTYEVEC